MNSRDPGLASPPSAAAPGAPDPTPLRQGLTLFHADPPDYRRAVGCFRVAAEAGDRDGLAMLGLCQLEGLGMKADAVQARAVLEQASTRGSAIGRFQLGRALMTGRGGPVDESRGLSAYIAAAARNHPEASFNLANCLYAGVGCLPDRLAAKALYLRSRTLGCTLQPQGVRVRQRELKAVRALALRFADPRRLIFLLQERQHELRLLEAVSHEPGLAAQRPGRSADAARPPWRLAAGVVAAMAGTLGHYLRPTSTDAGPTTLNF